MFRLTAKTSQKLHNIHTIKKQCQCIALHTGQAIHDNKNRLPLIKTECVWLLPVGLLFFVVLHQRSAGKHVTNN